MKLLIGICSTDTFPSTFEFDMEVAKGIATVLDIVFGVLYGKR